MGFGVSPMIAFAYAGVAMFFYGCTRLETAAADEPEAPVAAE